MDETEEPNGGWIFDKGKHIENQTKIPSKTLIKIKVRKFYTTESVEIAIEPF